MYMHKYINTHVHIYIYTYVHIYIYIYIHIYKYMYNYKFFLRADEKSEHRSLANDMESRHKIKYLSSEKVKHTECSLHLKQLHCL